MKTETIEEWKLRTGKKPRKIGYEESYKKSYSHGWITKNRKGIVLKRKKEPIPAP